MNNNLTDAQRLLVARLDDLVRASGRGELVCGNFLTPAEAAFCESRIKMLGLQSRAFFFGGYEGAERRRLYVIPAYLEGMSESPRSCAEEYLSDEIFSSVCAISIRGSGYRNLSHRDYLGSLLSLGIERHSLGDVIVSGDFEAVVFCTDRIRDHILSSLERVASDKVTVTQFDVTEDFAPTRATFPITDTIASDRLDCVVGALTNTSREKAQNIIRSGLCELDYIPEDRCDRRVLPPCTVSVRGFGKFSVIAFDGETKRGRLRLIAAKYV